MRTPVFWYHPPTPLAHALRPLGALYAAATARRVAQARNGYRATCPVLCVGNLNAGGTGKTPTAIAIATRLQDRGQKVVVLSKGYGGKVMQPQLVDAQNDTADIVGDEPLLMSAFAPTVVASDRISGAQFAEEHGADAIILDDGFQSPDLQKDWSLVVVDAGKGFGNGLCIPAGPLREPIGAGLARADAVLTIGSNDQQSTFRTPLPEGLSRIQGRLDPLPTGMPWAGLRVVAYAGIGLPEKFFHTLRQAGVDVVAEHGLGDHEPIARPLFERLAREAEAKNAQLVTTEKDAVKLPPDLRPRVLPFPVRLTIQDWTAIDAAFDRLDL